MKKFQSIKGTKDLLPEDTILWREVEMAIHNFMQLYGYGEIRTPVFEQTELFARGIGEGTDIVSKEMYSWIDQGGTNLTLKPELTAPVVRSYIQHNLSGKSPINRLYYIDSLFRRERPQKGRLRQFHQFGIEAIGSEYPEQDAEVISMAYKIYEMFGVDELVVKINSIGSPEIRQPYLQALRESLESHSDKLCKTCQSRLGKNALRLFDCKSESCKGVLDKFAVTIDTLLTEEDKKHFQSVLKYLDAMKIPYIHDIKLVRGLDYYTRTTFEIASRKLGAQDALCGGGRYDKLVEEFGGKPTPAIGFAAGIERLFIALDIDDTNKPLPLTDVYFVALGDEAVKVAFEIAEKLRLEKGIAVTVETLQRSMKAQMREANRNNAQFAFIIGDNEIAANKIIVKTMKSGEQQEVPIDKIDELFSTEHDCNCSDC
ncbi:MAG: histidine--tRNA ligase [Candidatus Marinimicrobia bacterium]|nr:histidine--tRNA ligase [Candidatus Neomarinimicrobiota bacterium]MBL7023157.1 histidine--tRNA ligase [Candidatus Neomarinimicrobiota bacterium]MBL7109035.1 histidine--tRNA ligase [Candidatus Neomarinimicrobiota bacterium]